MYPEVGWLAKFREFCNFIIIIGGAAYGIHYLWKVESKSLFNFTV